MIREVLMRVEGVVHDIRNDSLKRSVAVGTHFGGQQWRHLSSAIMQISFYYKIIVIKLIKSDEMLTHFN